MTAREEVLGRIRRALGTPAAADAQVPGPQVPDPQVPRYRTDSDLTGPELLDLLTERLSDYGSTVRRCRPDQLAATVGAALAERGVASIVIPPDLDLPGTEWADLAGGVTPIMDSGLSAEVLDTIDAVITTAAVAIAESGTIILDGSPGQGRRALTLIPDYHLCILHARQVVALVTQAVPMLDPHRPLTWISGPSATSDIELDRVQGVHGPRTLEVILVES
jgi:L-lactate dehydrogenase complex protein LldG